MNFLLKRRSEVRPSFKETFRRSYRSHEKFVRGFVCVCFTKASDECHGRIQCAHYRTAANAGKSQKPHSAWTFPACEYHHNLQHTIGQLPFEKRYGIDLAKLCKELALRSPVQEVREFARGMATMEKSI